MALQAPSALSWPRAPIPGLLLYAPGSRPLAWLPLACFGTVFLGILLLQILTLDGLTQKTNYCTQNDNGVPTGFILNPWVIHFLFD